MRSILSVFINHVFMETLGSNPANLDLVQTFIVYSRGQEYTTTHTDIIHSNYNQMKEDIGRAVGLKV